MFLTMVEICCIQQGCFHDTFRGIKKQEQHREFFSTIEGTGNLNPVTIARENLTCRTFMPLDPLWESVWWFAIMMQLRVVYWNAIIGHFMWHHIVISVVQCTLAYNYHFNRRAMFNKICAPTCDYDDTAKLQDWSFAVQYTGTTPCIDLFHVMSRAFHVHTNLIAWQFWCTAVTYKNNWQA